MIAAYRTGYRSGQPFPKTEAQVGKPLPTDIKVVSPSDVVLERYVWSSDGNTKVMEQGVGYSLHLSFVIKPGSEAYFHLSSVKAKVNETSGTGNNQFSPAQTCTRGQIATFLYRAFAG